MNAITVQEQHLPGDSLEQKFEIAQAWGFDGIELRSRGDLHFASRLPELRRAAASGVVMPTTCVEMSHFIGAFDSDLREDAIVQLSSQLTVMAEIGGVGVMTPGSYGMFSRRLPPFEPPRSPEEDRSILLDALGRLGEHAEKEGVELFLEPLNRYEDYLVNTLAQAADLIREVGSPAVRIVADTYHMNIEEADPAAALLAVAPYIGHLQASDSNRLEPGAGHIDWALFGATVNAIGYDRSIAIESRLSGDAADVLPLVAPMLRRYL
ncbi:MULTISPECIES: sugar phosphate isomerase/epimerase family protein [unclassified Leifsonia]|uniref:sugar phosphate isomerase/epimerase family protein n=1 Tax=unclassified Leifsonia TaxID=2663824 RepID=UPI0008A79818|nr:MULTISPECIES: sugar phosphate isomerase/epimerase family protein [unclassified Leifsonia]SEH66339.1 Sugar phosphate isomerase/epimerase [Leifsonia sp. CL154]SFL28083.1 Sugar phosphate isomerase/epimerase [Leifsonia sp. CL147]